MNWFKIEFNDVFLNGLTSAEVGCVVKYKCALQQHNCKELSEKQLKSIFNSRELKFVRKYFNLCSEFAQSSSEVSQEFVQSLSEVCSKKDSKNKEVGNIYNNIYNYIQEKKEKKDITPLSMSPLERVDDTPKEKVKRFVKPTIAEIQDYCRERSKSVDAERFWNFYESKGWKVGKNPMKDWRAAVCNWAKETSPIAQESYRPVVDHEKLKQATSIAELTKQRMMEQAKQRYGA
jgi:hypothetical protein